MTKVLCFFGAFNPPTKAHIELAKLAMQKTGAREVCFVPSRSSYILNEQKKDFCFSESERMDMLLIVCNENKKFFFNGHDIYSEEQPRTYVTLKYLERMWKPQGCIPVLLVGADQFSSMEEKWKNVPEIAKEFGIVVLTRRAFSIDAILQSSDFYREIAPYVTIVEAPASYRWISSTYVREQIKRIQNAQQELSKNLSPEIYDYIKRNYI